jgi:ribosomal-protein-alanine N-acetyltransferase
VLVALTPELARAALEDRAKLGGMIGAHVPESWPGADFARMLPCLARRRGAGLIRSRTNPPRRPRGGRALIGETGFHGPPNGRGTIEVGYSIIPAYRGRRFATEATRALIGAALARPEIRRITAECLDYNLASLRVLEKLGMRHIGSAGGTLRFELRDKEQ